MVLGGRKSETLNLVVCILLCVLDQVQEFPCNATGLKMVVGPKHVAVNLGCLHPAACVRSGDGSFIRLRNVIS
jgi:hypothetical protein